MATYTTGDTIRVQVTFREFAEPPEEGAIVDPSDVMVAIYNSDQKKILEVAGEFIIKEDDGIYYYDWTLPLTAGTFYIEFIGEIDDEPAVIRKPFKVKFAPKDT